ncbi:hypothetical protein N7G274_001863 [Stereocaulon virgatum]|uniref:Glycosyltransferase family 32 protein n=1 Tax=Stereocaulon virgatum TaxID=373712 RepID=A0ABR4ANL8_9LECA
MLSSFGSAMDLVRVHQFFNALLIVGAISAESGLLVLNRFILSAGCYKFPYPIATTLIQCCITYCLVFIGQQLAYSRLPYLKFIPCAVYLGGEEEASLLKYDDAGPDPTKGSREPSPQPNHSKTSSANKRFFEIIGLAIVYLLRTTLSNANIIRLPLSIYALFRASAVPLTLLMNGIWRGEAQSSLLMVSSLLGVSSLALNILSSAEPISAASVLSGVSMSILDTLLPVLLLTACYDRSQHSTNQDQPSDVRIEKSSVKAWRESGLDDATRKFWSTLRQMAFLSVFMLLPIFLLCGELQNIQRNSYVLDVSLIWILLVASGSVNAAILFLTALLAKTTSTFTPTFLTVPSNAIILVVFGGRLAVYDWTSIGLCWFFSLCFMLSQLRCQSKESAPMTITKLRSATVLLRGLTLGAVLWGCIYGIDRLHQESLPHYDDISICEKSSDAISNYTLAEAPGIPSMAKDDYLGPRPDVDTTANITLLVEACHEIIDGQGVDDVVNCLAFLTEKENDYLTLPIANSSQPSQRESRTSTPADASLAGDKNSSTNAASTTSIGTCPGQVMPFHVYWTGPATWRFELFVKAYLYTQNLPCSRLWIWLDEDIHPGAVNKMLCGDPIFQRFLPLVDRGDISLKSWKLPSRIPLPKETVNKKSGFYLSPRPSKNPDEAYVAEEVVQDTNDEYWLALNTANGFTPVQVSDAVRFIVLHLHGGVYLDMDVLLLRDMRPMLLPDPATGLARAFAEQWVERFPPSDYNTAVISLPANSTLSTYLLRGGVRMGMNFHPLVIGRMLWRDGRNDEVAMLHNAVFDPLVTNLRRMGTDTCTVPCHKNFKSAFLRVVEEPEKEWSNFYGEQKGDVAGTWPATNRSLTNFFRGAWAYHIHNQWWKFPEPTSWMDIITRAQDGFFDGTRTNAYGEHWAGPFLRRYDRDTWP